MEYPYCKKMNEFTPEIIISPSNAHPVVILTSFKQIVTSGTLVELHNVVKL